MVSSEAKTKVKECEFFIGTVDDVRIPEKYVKEARFFKSYMVGTSRFRVYVSTAAGVVIAFLMNCGLIYALISPFSNTLIKLLYISLIILYDYEFYIMLKYQTPKYLKRSYKCITGTLLKNKVPVLVRHECMLVRNNLFQLTCRMAWIPVLFSLVPNDKINGPWMFYNIKYRPLAAIATFFVMYVEILVPIIFYLVFKSGKDTVVQFPASFKMYRTILKNSSHLMDKYLVINAKHYFTFPGIVATTVAIVLILSFKISYNIHIFSYKDIIILLLFIALITATLTSIIVKKYAYKIASIMSSHPYASTALFLIFFAMYGFCGVMLLSLIINPPGM